MLMVPGNRGAYPFFSPEQMVWMCERWGEIAGPAIITPRSPEGEELALLSVGLAMAADAANAGMETGALKELQRKFSSAGPGRRDVVDLSVEGSEAFVWQRASQEMYKVQAWAAEHVSQSSAAQHQNAHAVEPTPVPGGAPRRPKGREKKQDRFIRVAQVLRDNPNASMSTIAREIGCATSTLSRDPKIQQLMMTHSRSKTAIPRGYRRSGGGDVEAIDPADD